MKTRLMAGVALLAAACHSPAPKLVFTTEPQNAIAGDELSPVAVTVVSSGQTPSGPTVLVSLSWYGDAGTPLLLESSAVSSHGGVATFDHAHIDVAGHGYVLTATAAGFASAISSPFDVTAGPGSASKTTVRARPRAVPANGTSTIALTVTVADSLGNPVSGQPVTISVSGSRNVLSPLNGVTDMTGQFVATLASPQQELKTVSATVLGTVLTTTVGFTGPCTGTVMLPSVPWVGVDGWPNSVVTADFNGDGKLDVASLNEGSNEVTVLLGNGDGTFAAPKVLSLGGSSGGLVAADLNGDGRVDLAMAGPDENNVSILEGNGDGTFRTGATYAVPVGPQGIIAADLNNDGWVDLVVSSQSVNSVSVLLGQDGGTFAPAVPYSVGAPPTAMAVADLNGDRKLDIVVANSQGTSILFGNGDGTFGAEASIDAGAGSAAVVAQDLNGDGKIDLVVAENLNGQPVLAAMLGNGDGTFRPSSVLPFYRPVYELQIGDLNGDGKPDLVVSSPELWVWLGDGDGGFTAVPTSHLGGNAFALGDLDGDGRLDVAFGEPGAVGILIGAGDGTFRTPDVYDYGQMPTAIGVGDFNGDGWPDMVLPSGVLLNQHDGTFGPPKAYPIPNAPSAYAAADFNADGRLDLAVIFGSSYFGGPAQILLGRGDGTFTAGTALSGSSTVRSLTAADFNRDGMPDLLGVAPGYGAQLLWFPGHGDGTFGDGIVLDGGAAPSSAAVADFDGDGKLDIAVTDQGLTSPSVGTLRILLGGGDGTFRDRPTRATGQGPFGVITADLNGDGTPDLVLNNSFDNDLMVFLGNGDGSFRAPVTYAGPNTGIESNVLSVVAGDVNGDGKLDLIEVFDETDYAWVLEGNGDGTFRAPIVYGVGGFPTSVAVADVDGDGTTDLLFGADQATVLLSLGCKSCAPTTCAALGAPCRAPDGCGGELSCSVCGAGTFCGDGSCVPTPQWTSVNTPAPPARYGAAMAFDSARGKTVLFGGEAPYTPLFGDTWERAGGTWTEVSTSGPSPRVQALLAYDVSQGAMTLFGGYDNSGAAFTDTWSWSGSAWSPLATSGPASNQAMAYDSARGRLVVFMGSTGETWEWDGSSWARRSAFGPPPRFGPAMAYDARRGRTVLFGGTTDAPASLGDTWEWDGIGWQQVAVQGPSRRDGATMFYSTGRGRIVLFGGLDLSVLGGQLLQDTWEWDGTSWVQMPITGPAGRTATATTFDGSRDAGVLFGGQDALHQALGDVWEYQ